MEPTPEQTAFMAKNWRDLIRPRLLEIEERSETYGKFSCEPLERGFGTTLGTGLRRVLLSSLQGAAITQISIEGALHEFSSLPGVVEDVTDIILNLKETLFKVEVDKTYTLRLDKHGEGTLTFHGRRYPITVGGISGGLAFGASKTYFHGTVRHIRRARDVTGVYGAAGGGGALGKGAQVIVMTNDKGAELELSGKQVGLQVNADVSGMTITMK